MLQIAVHGNDVFAAGVVETGGKSRGLAKIPAQLDDSHTAVHGCDLAKQVKAAIRGTIVHQHHFETFAIQLHDRFQAIVEVSDVLLLVVQGDNDGIFWHEIQLYDYRPVFVTTVYSPITFPALRDRQANRGAAPAASWDWLEFLSSPSRLPSPTGDPAL